MKLNRAHPCAATWQQLLDTAGTDLRPGSQPWQMYPISPIAGPNRLQAVPALPGPLIYAVPQWNGWGYVGHTQQTLNQRLTRHLRDDPDRAARWDTVMALPLDPTISAARLGQMERAGRDRLNPRTGSRWPTATPPSHHA